MNRGDEGAPVAWYLVPVVVAGALAYLVVVIVRSLLENFSWWLEEKLNRWY